MVYQVVTCQFLFLQCVGYKYTCHIVNSKMLSNYIGEKEPIQITCPNLPDYQVSDYNNHSFTVLVGCDAIHV